MKQPAYTLGNGEDRNKEAPDTFWIPAKADRECVPKGFYVKLMFSPISSDRAERMWVQVTDRHEDGHYTGVLNNDPVIIQAVCGYEVIFRPEHILQILDENGQEPATKH